MLRVLLVYLRALFTYVFTPTSLAQATPPRDRLRGRCAFVIYNFGTISCLVAEGNPS
jgi:hypothetical protein